jgi:hypothetical protein
LWLFIPTIANLFLTYFILKIYLKKELTKVPHSQIANGEEVMAVQNNDEQLLSTDDYMQ